MCKRVLVMCVDDGVVWSRWSRGGDNGDSGDGADGGISARGVFYSGGDNWG